MFDWTYSKEISFLQDSFCSVVALSRHFIFLFYVDKEASRINHVAQVTFVSRTHQNSSPVNAEYTKNSAV